MTNDNGNRLDRLDQEQQRVTTSEVVPEGYLEVNLSTKGHFGAPESFHIRNFDTSDLMNLALTETEDLPEKVAKMIDGLILEDISVLDFHEKEVIETLVFLYQSFYSNFLNEAEFPWTEEDLEAMRSMLGNEQEYLARVQELKNRKWIPRTDINLEDVPTYEPDFDKLKPIVYVKNKQGFTAGFSFPRYGDVLTLRNFIKKEFKELDKQYANLVDTLKFRRDAEARIRNGEEIQLSRLPQIPDAEKEKLKKYEEEKQIFSVRAIKALHLYDLDGVSMKGKPLSERIKAAQDPRLDYRMMKKINEYFTDMPIGLNAEEVPMRNPITATSIKRRYSFRIVDLLQAIKLYDSDDYDLLLEPPDQQ